MFTTNFFKNITNILLLLLIGLVLFLILRIERTNEEVIATNRLVYETLVNKRIKELQEAKKNDIVIGDTSAPVTMVMYTKYSCVYCRSFFEKTYPELYQEYIKTGLVKFVIRFLVPPAYSHHYDYMSYAYQCYYSGKYDEFSSLLEGVSMEKLNDSTLTIIAKKVGLIPNGDHYSLEEKYKEAKKAGINVTPVFLIDNHVYKGNRPLFYFKRKLNEVLDGSEE